MAQVTKRVGGQLVETSDANTQQLAQLQGQPISPQTPAGTAALGGTPDQAKMVGSSAQKKTVLNEATKPADTLTATKRVEQPGTNAAPAAEAQAKAQQLSQLGSLSTRVEALIKNDLAQLQAVTPQQAVDQTQVQATAGALAPEKQAQLQALLQKVAAAPQDQTVLAEAAQWAQDNLGLDATTFTPQTFIAKASQTLGGAAASQVRDSYTLATLPLQTTEQEALTAVFGEEWKNLTVPQLAQRVEDLRQAEFAKGQALRAELATATGAQREQLLGQLAALGQSGAAGTEQEVRAIADQVATANVVKLGGEEHKVEDLLKDEEISGLVTRMLGNPKLAEEVAKSNPEFAAWVKSNAAGLEKLAKDVAQSQGTLVATQQAKRAKAKVGEGLELSDKIMRAIDPTWGKVTTEATAPTAGFYQALTSPNLPPATKRDMVAALTKYENDPEMLAKIAKMDAGSFRDAYESANAVQNDKSGLLAKLSGASTDDELLLDPAQLTEVQRYKPLADIFSAADQSTPGMQELLEDRDGTLAAMIRSGEINQNLARQLVSKPTRLAAYKEYQTAWNEMQRAVATKDINAVMDKIFGRDVDPAAVNAEYDRARAILRTDPRNADARAKFDRYRILDTNMDNKLDGNDVKTMVASYTNFATEPASLEDIINGDKLNSAFAKDLQGSTLDQATVKRTNFGELFSAATRDNKLSFEEMEKLEAAGQLDQVWEMPAAEQKRLGVAAKSAFEGYKSQKEVAAAKRDLGMGTGDTSVGNNSNNSVYASAYWAAFNGKMDDLNVKLQRAKEMANSSTNKDVKAFYKAAAKAMEQAVADVDKSKREQAAARAADTKAKEDAKVQAKRQEVVDRIARMQMPAAKRAGIQATIDQFMRGEIPESALMYVVANYAKMSRS